LKGLFTVGRITRVILPGSLLRSVRLPRDLRRAIADAGLHPSQIILELTEHDPILNAADLLRVLDPFLEAGMQLSLDDVGVGFANMRLICELQPHFIKVDSFFIEGLSKSLVKQSVVQNFVNLTSDIGPKIVAEGVEQDEDALTAMRLGVGFLQEPLFGRPMGEPCLAPLPQGFWKTLQSTSQMRIL
jgi:EAL domain-containing protein (putative c-di-GMP-specific phosphodiesterase class I)